MGQGLFNEGVDQDGAGGEREVVDARQFGESGVAQVPA